MLTATVLATCTASIPYVGIVIAAGLAATAAFVRATLIALTAWAMPALDVCQGSTSTAVRVFKPVAFIVGVGLLVFAVGAFAGLGPPPG